MTEAIARLVSDHAHLALSIVRAPQTVQTIVDEQHHLTGRAADELSHAILGTLAFATRLKGPGILSVQRDHDGPFAGWRVEAMGLGFVRAMVPGAVHEHLASDPSAVDAPAVDGTLRVSRQMADGGQPYQSILAAPAVPITELLNMHLSASEQVPARILTDVGCGTAVYVERLPGAVAEWPAWESLIATDAPQRDLSIGNNLDLAAAVAGAADWRQLREYPVRFHCPCARENYQKTLSGFKPEQLREISDGRGMITAVCDFCRTRYEFALDDLV